MERQEKRRKGKGEGIDNRLCLVHYKLHAENFKGMVWYVRSFARGRFYSFFSFVSSYWVRVERFKGLGFESVKSFRGLQAGWKDTKKRNKEKKKRNS